MLNEGSKVLVKNGKNKGKTATVLRALPMSQFQDLTNGQDISMKDAIKSWLIEFENGEQVMIKESGLELISE